MILIDTSIWIDYFKGKDNALPLNHLIDSNKICITDLILTELLPSINHKKEYELKELILSVEKIELDIDWDDIMNMQLYNYQNRINNVGIPDLIIVQNVIKNGLSLFASDKHLSLMSEIFGFKMYKGEFA